jgi:predicted amidohydrolase
VKVAAAQIECRPGRIGDNLALHLDMIEAAGAEGIELLVFPELSLTDYLAAPDLTALARPTACAELAKLAHAAGRMWVSAGFIEAGADGRFYNAQALLNAGGIAHIHRKINLPTYGLLAEGRYYSPGREVAPAVVNGSTVATLICADTWNPALPWLAAIQEPDLLLVPVASSRFAVSDDFDNPDGWTINLRHTALTYGLPIIMANHCGQRAGCDFWGGSRILDARGQELARADHRPALIMAEVGRADTGQARHLLPTIRDADPQLVQRELDRILRSQAGATGFRRA